MTPRTWPRWPAIALAILFTAARPAPAQHMDKALFLEIATGPDEEARALLLVYLRGALNGLESANMTLRRRGEARLFCPPAEPPIDPDWMINELLGYLKRYPAIPDTVSIAVIGTFALQEAYPCEQRSGG